MKTVKELMRSFPYSCKEEDSLKFVASRMSISSITFIPVLDKQERVIGTLTFDSICKTIRENNLTDKEMKVKEIMSSEPVFLHGYEDEATALMHMRNYHLNYVPVVDDDNHLEGMVSFISVARRIVELKHAMKLLKLNFS
ncbi:hypothetical protein CNR22_01415 [Sphingobacteriaceae bacterium]|nr:hypothetical protein CNR22_01415 [Sphingobacteriaceae bacterium]